jgi:hypothetical protein
MDDPVPDKHVIAAIGYVPLDESQAHAPIKDSCFQS